MLSVFNVCSIRACTRVYALIGADRRVYAPIGAQCECCLRVSASYSIVIALRLLIFNSSCAPAGHMHSVGESMHTAGLGMIFYLLI